MATHKLVICYEDDYDRQPFAMLNTIADRYEYVPRLPARVARFTPDGARLVVGGLRIAAGFKFLRVFNADTMIEETGWPGDDGTAAAALEVSANHIAILTGSTNLRAYSLTTKALVQTITLPSSCWGIAFSADGAYLAVTYSPGVLRVYDTATWSIVAGTPAPADADQIAFSPDGAYLAVAAFNGSAMQLYIYDVSTWAAVPTGIGSTPNYFPPKRITWRPDSKRVAVLGDAEILAWDVPGWAVAPVVLPFPSGEYVDRDIAFLPDGRLAVGVQALGAYSATGEFFMSRFAILSASLDSVDFDGLPIKRLPWGFGVAPGPTKRLSGSVETDTAAPAAGRRVLAMHDGTERIVGAATTAADGSYSISTPHADGHTVVLIESNTRAQASGSGIVPV